MKRRTFITGVPGGAAGQAEMAASPPMRSNPCR